MTTTRLDAVTQFLSSSNAIQDKIAIDKAFAPALETAEGFAAVGDDCAAMPDGRGGYLLLAAEGLLGEFVADDPWFAGYSAVMVNISDVCAMGGRPTAVVDVLWSPDRDQSAPVWDGMRAAAKDYGVPIVGGHTTYTREPGQVSLAAAILGRASSLLTSFDAKPGDELLMAVDLDGSYRGDKPFWNASVGTPPERLQSLIALLPEVAERGLCRSAKDISNGGIVGTLVMLLACSKVGARLELDAIPRPPEVAIEKWLVSFPSFGYLLSVSPDNRKSVEELFAALEVACTKVGRITRERTLALALGGESQHFWSASMEES